MPPTTLPTSSTTDTEWETLFSDWAKPPGKSEQNRCDNAVSAIKNAINKCPKLKPRSITVFPQGSYRNRVNVRQDSDVDVGVLCNESYFYKLPPETTLSQLGNSDGPAAYSFSRFKDELEEALVAHFGRSAVSRGNKAFDLHETTYHVEADVVPVFEYRTYAKNGFYIAGVALRPDNGGRIENFPERLLEGWPQIPLHYENGVTKNDKTSRRFKSIVRIIKKLRNLMDDSDISEATAIPSYLIECLVWNVDNNRFRHKTWLESVRSIFAAIWRATITESTCSKWCEVDDVKYLFRATQPWTRKQAHDFIDKAWDLVGVS